MDRLSEEGMVLRAMLQAGVTERTVAQCEWVCKDIGEGGSELGKISAIEMARPVSNLAN